MGGSGNIIFENSKYYNKDTFIDKQFLFRIKINDVKDRQLKNGAKNKYVRPKTGSPQDGRSKAKMKTK